MRGNVGGPLPGTGGGGGGPVGGETGGGNSSSDITNEIDDPCLNQTVNKALQGTGTAKNLIEDIIGELDGDKSVEIKVIDGITPSGRPGEAVNQNLTTVGGVPTKFGATIILNEAYMADVSQEGTIAIFIHEVLHAYLTKVDLINSVKTNQHQTMATDYVAPMANYLQELFGVSELDAFSLAWAGLTYTGAYTNVTSFNVEGATYSKNDIIQAAAKYMGRGADGKLLNGKELCDD